MVISLKMFRVLCLAFLVGLMPAYGSVIVGTGGIGGGTLGFTSANAMVLNPEGIGHVLFVPYFSTQDENVTAVSVTNHDKFNGKAVKIRFRGAVNADSLFDLTVFLAPGDVWSAAVKQNVLTGLTELSTSDRSCTLPALVSGQAYSFNTGRLNPALSLSDRAAQTREGFVEIIAMADVPPSNDPNALFGSLLNIGTGPRNCASDAVLATLKDADDETAAATLGFATPTGNLRSNWSIINIAQTLTYSGNAFALMAIDRETGLPGRGRYMFFPQNANTAGNVDAFTADPLLRSLPYASKTADGQVRTYSAGSVPLVKPLMYDLPDLSTPYVLGVTDPMRYAEMVSTALVAKAVRNDYSTDSDIEARTDWVFAFPTKRFSVAMDYGQNKLVYNVMTGFGQMEYFSGENTYLKDGKICQDYRFTFFDREGSSKTSANNDFSALGVVNVCGMVSVMPFGDSAASAMGAKLTAVPNGARAYVNGWGRIDVSNGYTGMPLVGASHIRAKNSNAAPGISGSYGIFSQHKYER